jgi:hypothetical protein
MSSLSRVSHETFQLIVPCCAVSCFLQTNFYTFLFLAICIVIRCVVLRDSCYRYFRSDLILLNKADPAAVNTCPLFCMRSLMYCRFLSTLSRLLIFSVGDGDVSCDVIGEAVRDDAGDAVRDDAGVGVLDVADPCCSANISALMFSIICSCFTLCCMTNLAIRFLFVSHSATIWCLLSWLGLPDTLCCP